jgi:hypothetical protein
MGVAERQLDHAHLKTKQREIRSAFPESLALRVHRALSWLKRAEQEQEDFDAAFIFYWVAFNAAYAEDRTEEPMGGERSVFEGYFTHMISLDSKNEIYDAIWDKFSDSIRVFLENKYVFQPFWSHHNQVEGYDDWEDRFERSKRKVQYALSNKDTKVVLSTLYDRLYVLRNQLIHGGATWNGSVNRSQVSDGARIMAFLVPLFIDLMMDNPKSIWGDYYYPVVD